jgi:curved DNA-binding protein CbpA
MPLMKDYFKILGVTDKMSDDQIKQVFRQKAKLLHPDLNENNPAAAEKLIEINEAYGVISDKGKREKYLKEYQSFLAQQAANRQAAQGPRFNPQFNQTFSGGFNPYGAKFASDPRFAQAQAQQAQAQAQAQQAMVDQIAQNAFNQGYSKGFSDSSAKQNEKEKMHAEQIKALMDRLRAAESAKLAFDRHQKELSDKIDSLTDEIGGLKAENESLWIQIGDEKDSPAQSVTEVREAYGRQIETLNAKIKALNTEIQAQKTSAKTLETAAFEKELEVKRLINENKALEERILSYEQYVETQESEQDRDQMIAERENKLKQVKKMIKNTYYGSLGVVYWADNDVIKSAYDKLIKRYQAKQEKGDIRAKNKIAELENAYNALTNEKARKSYNATIDITDEDIAQEIEEENAYNTAMESWLKAKEEDDFWAYVDELMFLSQTGDADSQNLLGEMYYYGDEIEQDLEQAFYWFKEAAKQQQPDALLNLGKCYLNGEGISRDETKGLGFIRQAAKLGNKEAQGFVGLKSP